MTWIGFAIFAIVLIAKLNFDYWQYLKGRKIRHGAEAAVVTVCLLGAAYFSGWASIPMFFFGFWVLFDGLFNVITGQKWGRIGETAKLDKLQRKYPFLVWVKYIGLALSILWFLLPYFIKLPI